MIILIAFLSIWLISQLFGGRFISRQEMQIFETNFIDVKRFYTKEFGIVPCLSFIGNIDTGKAYGYINGNSVGRVVAIYQRNYHSWQNNRTEIGTTIFVIENDIMIELGYDYAQILFPKNNYKYSNDLMKILVTYRLPAKEVDFEINIITLTTSGLELKPLAIRPTVLDLHLYYNDDFMDVDNIIQMRLKKENDKGIILLHGLPGTGKTTYLRYLIGKLKKKVLFVSPAVADNLMNPEFIDLLIENPNAVVVIEDAENIIMDRKFNSNSSVSNLLNLSDGLLSDCLNVQIICTFNNALSMVDSALMRKGRLIAKYEFGKLGTEKAQLLSDHLALDQIITHPMTLAEITNPGEKEFEMERIEVLGFRRNELQMN